MTSIAWRSHLAEVGCGDVVGPCPSVALDVLPTLGEEPCCSPDHFGLLMSSSETLDIWLHSR
jgi:hypothetical protein